MQPFTNDCSFLSLTSEREVINRNYLLHRKSHATGCLLISHTHTHTAKSRPCEDRALGALAPAHVDRAQSPISSTGPCSEPPVQTPVSSPRKGQHCTTEVIRALGEKQIKDKERSGMQGSYKKVRKAARKWLPLHLQWVMSKQTHCNLKLKCTKTTVPPQWATPQTRLH